MGLDGDEWAAQMDPRQWPALKARLAAQFRTRTRDDWVRRFTGPRRLLRAGARFRRGVSPTRTTSRAAPSSRRAGSDSRRPPPAIRPARPSRRQCRARGGMPTSWPNSASLRMKSRRSGCELTTKAAGSHDPTAFGHLQFAARQMSSPSAPLTLPTSCWALPLPSCAAPSAARLGRRGSGRRRPRPA